MDLVLGAGSLAHQRGAAGDPAAQRLCVSASGTQTLTSIPAASRSARVRASKRSDFTRAWEIARTSWALATTTLATCGARMRAISIAGPVTSIATSSRGSRLSRSVATRPAE